ncbi:MAG: amino acid ABC transporter permease [Brachybacterium sp.]|nr:amino acid ABC transporter permease [Brachybacterium sp.]
MDVVLDNGQLLLRGIGTTLGLTLAGYTLALLVGTALAVCRVSPIPPLRWAATLYVEIFRNVPLLSLLVLLAFGLPDIGVMLPLFWTGVAALMLSSAAFVCEMVRSGINTVPVGHAEAARSIGLGFVGTLRHVVLPQAFRAMVQPLVNVFIGTLIGSSLCAAISVSETTYVTQAINIQTARSVLTFLVAGAVYLMIALGGAYIGARIERAVSPAAAARRRTVGPGTMA